MICETNTNTRTRKLCPSITFLFPFEPYQGYVAERRTFSAMFCCVFVCLYRNSARLVSRFSNSFNTLNGIECVWVRGSNKILSSKKWLACKQVFAVCECLCLSLSLYLQPSISRSHSLMTNTKKKILFPQSNIWGLMTTYGKWEFAFHFVSTVFSFVCLCVCVLCVVENVLFVAMRSIIKLNYLMINLGMHCIH